MKNKLKTMLIIIIVSLYTRIGVTMDKTISEIYEDGCYRLPGGMVIVKIPDLEDSWRIKKEDSNNMKNIIITWQKGKSLLGRITLSFPLNMKKVFSASQMAQAMASQMQKQLPFLKVIKHGQVTIKGGTGYSILLVGKNDRGEGLMVTTFGLSSKRYAMFAVIEGFTGNFNPLFSLIDKIFASLYLGENVPRLFDVSSGQSLHGVFNGPGEITYDGGWKDYWLVFDKRGWCHTKTPYGAIESNLEAMYQFYPDRVRKYRISGNKIIFTNLNGESYSYKFKFINNNRVQFESEDYERVDGGRTNGLKLNGHYQSSTSYSYDSGFDEFYAYASKDYYFKSDGTFSINSSVYSSYGDHNGSINSYNDSNPTSGTYSIKDDYIIFTYSNGKVIKKSFYLRFTNGKYSTDVLFIGGSNYLIDN